MIIIIELVMRLKLKRQTRIFFIVNILLLMAIVAFESRLTDAQEIIIDLK